MAQNPIKVGRDFFAAMEQVSEKSFDELTQEISTSFSEAREDVNYNRNFLYNGQNFKSISTGKKTQNLLANVISNVWHQIAKSIAEMFSCWTLINVVYTDKNGLELKTHEYVVRNSTFSAMESAINTCSKMIITNKQGFETTDHISLAQLDIATRQKRDELKPLLQSINADIESFNQKMFEIFGIDGQGLQPLKVSFLDNATIIERLYNTPKFYAELTKFLQNFKQIINTQTTKLDNNESLKDAVSHLNEEIKKLNNLRNAHVEKLCEKKDVSQAILSEIAEINKQIEYLQKPLLPEIAEKNKEQQQLENTLLELTQKLQTYQSFTEEKLSQAKEKLTHLNKQKQANNNTITKKTLQTDLAIDNVQEEIHQLEEIKTSRETAIPTLQKQIGEIETQLTKVQSDLASLSERLDTEVGNPGATQYTINQLTDRKFALQRQLDEIDDELETLDELIIIKQSKVLKPEREKLESDKILLFQPIVAAFTQYDDLVHPIQDTLPSEAELKFDAPRRAQPAAE